MTFNKKQSFNHEKREEMNYFLSKYLLIINLFLSLIIILLVWYLLSLKDDADQYGQHGNLLQMKFHSEQNPVRFGTLSIDNRFMWKNFLRTNNVTNGEDLSKYCLDDGFKKNQTLDQVVRMNCFRIDWERFASSEEFIVSVLHQESNEFLVIIHLTDGNMIRIFTNHNSDGSSAYFVHLETQVLPNGNDMMEYDDYLNNYDYESHVVSRPTKTEFLVDRIFVLDGHPKRLALFQFMENQIPYCCLINLNLDNFEFNNEPVKCQP